MRWLVPAAALAAIVVVISLFYQSAEFSSRTGEDAPLYSVRRHDPSGTGALMELLAERGVEVRTLQQPNLDPHDRGILIQVLQVSPGLFMPQAVQSRQMMDWLAEGNTIIQFTRQPTGLMKQFKITATTQPSDQRQGDAEESEEAGRDPEQSRSKIEQAKVTTAMQPATGAPAVPLTLIAPMVFENKQPPGWTPLATLESDPKKVVAGEYRVGRGRLIVVGAPTPVLNGWIGDAGNLDFVLGVIAAQGNGPVLFDEWSRGLGHEATVVGFLRAAGLLPLIVQLAFIAMLYVWSTSGHREPDRITASPRPSSIEQIETLGHLYSQSFTPVATFARVKSEVLHRLAQAMHCHVGALSAGLASLSPPLRKRIGDFVEQVQQLEPVSHVHCLSCGHDLSMSPSGRCSECGAEIPAHLRERVNQPVEKLRPENRLPPRADRHYAELLNISHHLALEVQRERRSIR